MADEQLTGAAAKDEAAAKNDNIKKIVIKIAIIAVAIIVAFWIYKKVK